MLRNLFSCSLTGVLRPAVAGAAVFVFVTERLLTLVLVVFRGNHALLVDCRGLHGLVLPKGWWFRGARRCRGGEQACRRLSRGSCVGHVRRRGECFVFLLLFRRLSTVNTVSFNHTAVALLRVHPCSARVGHAAAVCECMCVSIAPPWVLVVLVGEKCC